MRRVAVDRLRWCCVPLVVAFTAAPACAQSIGQSLEKHLRYSAGDAWAVLTSPLHSDAKGWLGAIGVLGGSAALSAWDDDVDRWMLDRRDASAWSALKQVREGGYAFSGRTITPLAIGAFAVALATKNQRLQEGMFGCLTGYVATSTVRTFVFYPLMARTRPDSGHGTPSTTPSKNGDQYAVSFPGTSNWGRHSTPAGHITNVAACASFLSHRFSMGPAEPLAYAVVAGVGAGRLLDRRHWLSDTSLGLLFGYAVGKQLAIRSSHRERELFHPASAAAASRGLSVAPSATGMGVSWHWSF